MNSVNIVHNIFKYKPKRAIRHISYNNNIVYFTLINHLQVNKKTKHIINEYKRYINRKNTNIIIKCFDHNINISPITYLMSHDDIRKISIAALINGKYLFDCYFEKQKLKKIFEVSVFDKYTNSHHEIIECLKRSTNKLKTFKLINNYVDDMVCTYACYNGYINLVKYMHRNLGLSKINFTSYKNTSCRFACVNGHIDVVKYLHKHVKLTKKDFDTFDNFAHYYAMNHGNVNILRYLDEEINTPYPQSSLFINNVVANGHYKMIEYLHKRYRLCKYNFRDVTSSGFIELCNNGYLNLQERVSRNVTLNKSRIRAICERIKNHVSLSKYLYINLGVKLYEEYVKYIKNNHEILNKKYNLDTSSLDLELSFL